MKRYLALLLFVLAGCSVSSTPELRGVWGSEGAELTIADGGSSLLFYCGTGEIPGEFSVDASGNFNLVGTYDFGFCGGLGVRVPCGGDVTPQPARYTGHVAGHVMTLRVVPEKLPNHIFTLRKGVQGQVGAPCP